MWVEHYDSVVVGPLVVTGVAHESRSEPHQTGSELKVRVTLVLLAAMKRDVKAAWLPVSTGLRHIYPAGGVHAVGSGIRQEFESRFARDLVAQELGILLLIQRGVRVITANGDDLCDTSDPSRVMMRQIAGAFAQYEKARLVARLKRARELKGRLGGRKPLAETRPEVVELARKLRQPTRSGKQRSLREISAELAARGFVAEKTGRPYEAAQVSRMLGREDVLVCHGARDDRREAEKGNRRRARASNKMLEAS